MIKKIRRFLPLVVALFVFPIVLGQESGSDEWLTVFVTLFVAILLEAMPFMLIGSLVSGTIEVMVPRERIAGLVPKNKFLAVLLFGLLGIVFPICECGIVPVIRRLLRKGVPLSCGITYLLAAPIVQPIVLAATLVAFNGNWKIAGFRILGGYLVAITVGLLSILVLDHNSAEHIAFDLHDHRHEESCGCGEDHDHGCDCGETEIQPTAGVLQKAEYVFKHAAEDFLSTGSYLIFGAFLAAGMQTFVSQDMLSKLGHGVVMGPLVMMALAFVMSLCSAADAFVAAAFTQFSIASRMAFLVMGPMVDIKLMAMYSGFLSRKATIFVFGSASTLAFVYALCMHWIRL